MTRKFIPTCHYRGAYGHFRPYCYKLQIYWRRNGSRRVVKSTAPNFVWIKKEIGLFAAHTARKSNTDGVWLKAKLISISQLCDQNLYVKFTKDGCLVMDDKHTSILEGTRTGDNCYKLLLSHQCQYTRETAQLWHKRLGHIHARGLHKLVKYGAVRGLPTLTGNVETVCRGCMEGKQYRTSHFALRFITTKQPLQLLHIDLMGPVQTESIAGKRYVLVCVDDFTRFTWVEFLREKSEAYKLFVSLFKRLMTEKGVTIGKVVRIRSDHGKEFKNHDFANFYERKGISHEFSAPKTPQKNGIVERKNRTLQEMSRTMIHSKDLPHKLCAEAVNTACYVSNRVHLRYLTHKIPYELCKGRKPNVHYFREFGSRCHVLRDREQLRKFDFRSVEGIFVGYSRDSHAYRVFLRSANIVIETVNVEIADQNEDLQKLDDEHVPSIQKGETVSTETGTSEATSVDTPEVTLEELSIEESPEEMEVSYTKTHESVSAKENTPSIRVQKNNSADAIISDVNEGMKTRDEEGNVNRNKAPLVAQRYTQVEGIDFDETFAPVARLESIRLLLAVASMMKIKLHQMDVKSAFLNDYLTEKVYVEQPKGFEDPHRSDCVYRLTKALYGLKQAPRAWYERLTHFLCSKGFTRGVDKTLFIKKRDHELTMAQIYVDDIIFGSTIKKFGLDYAKAMRTPISTTDRICRDENGTPANPTLYRSMIVSLLYLTTSRPDICYSVGLCARFHSAPKESHVKSVKRIIRYVKNTVNLGIWYVINTCNVLAGYSDADWAGDADDRKNTSGGCFYLGTNLMSWYSKKQNFISLSTAEAEYIAAGSCCAQLLWMKQMLFNYGVPSGVLTVYCDNTIAINISKNPVQHSRTKHIDIRHHFIRELVEGGKVTLKYFSTENKLADIFTKILMQKDLSSFVGL
ncbi:hypothetical protein H6P81_010479 [Aristolochia fimbriata]|uniref:Integrase catalytic domain-containing protein n=1 Tax=Aristolochia fimbriata TaxID=158543 RepID=A0AAV7EPI9_ARIFI|nr:hypothetical protein H6P81_010479 [Aristolochia fimbriata]